MNNDWKNFLINNSAIINDQGNIEFPTDLSGKENFLCPVSYLGILVITGQDAAKFLQGQVTCNILDDINDNKSTLGALCTAKGRTISTFLVIKKDTSYYLILPVALIETVRKRLQMYILRSDVSIDNGNNEFCLTGLVIDHTTESLANLPTQPFAVTDLENITVRYPSPKSRYLVIEKIEQAKQFWSTFINKDNFSPKGDEYWKQLDIMDGIPWLDEQTSEDFIPQMLNLDQLGGISFNKGCYTGQEIVARTHYLGKSKRKMYFAEAQITDLAVPNATIYDFQAGTEQSVGKILSSLCIDNKCHMQVIIQAEIADSEHLKLKNGTEIKLTELSYTYLN